jgi:hypothetical protein
LDTVPRASGPFSPVEHLPAIGPQMEEVEPVLPAAPTEGRQAPTMRRQQAKAKSVQSASFTAPARAAASRGERGQADMPQPAWLSAPPIRLPPTDESQRR